MKSNFRPIGDFIRLVDERNRDLSIDMLLGLSVTKDFIPSVANTIGADMANYKIIRKGQFACSIMQVRRDKKMPVALLTDFEEAIISQAYPVFEVIDENELMPEYLMMWMTRSEFDRHACFLAVGGVRGSLEWDDFLEMPLPIPSIEKQREIVKEYNTVVNRIQLNEQLNQKLEETAQALYKHWFVDFEFPVALCQSELVEDQGGDIDYSKGYKSSGGKMVYNEELEKEIPEGWEAAPFTKIVDLKGGGTPSTNILSYWNGDVPFYTPGDLEDQYYVLETTKSITELGLANCSSKMFPANTTFLTARGATTGGLAICAYPMAMNQTCYALCAENDRTYYIHQFAVRTIKEIKNQAIGATFEALVTRDFDQKLCPNPDESVVTHFENKVSSIYSMMLNVSLQNQKLEKLENLILSKMTQVEVAEKEVVDA